MGKNMKKVSIQKKILFSFSGILCISFIAVGILVAMIIRQYSKEMAINYSSQILSLASENMNQQIDAIDSISKQLIVNEEIRNYCMRADELNEYQRVMSEYWFRKGLMSNTLHSNEIISSIFIYPSNGYCLSFGENQIMMTTEYKNWAIYKSGIMMQKPCWFASRKIKIGYGYENIISITRPFMLESSWEDAGMIEIQIPAEQMITWLNNFPLSEDSEILIFDAQGNEAVCVKEKLHETEIVYQYAKEQVTTKKNNVVFEVNGIEYMLNGRVLQNDWLVVYLQEMDSLTRTSDAIIKIILLSVIILLIIMISLSGNISRQLVRPIKDAIVATSNMNEDIEINGSECEITELFSNYNLMMQRIRESELETLRAQVTPHFLYNTLNSIRCRALLDGNGEIAGMIKWLINLLELSIKNNRTMLSLAEEISMLESYVNLQKSCLDKEFVFEVEIENEYLINCQVPKMILQIIVENAIIHGINERDGKIVVSCYRKDEMLCIEVKDNGSGMSEEQIVDILAGKTKGNKRKMNRVGIYNVDQRIKTYYGKEYGISMKSIKEKGTVVKIEFPYKKCEE